jgi:hypothetical protein
MTKLFPMFVLLPAGAVLASWTHKPALNCYVDHGATQIDDDSLGSMTISACQAKCDERSDCTAVAVDTHDGECWRRKDIVLEKCDIAEFDTWVKHNTTWTQKKGLNCYSDHGATEIDKDPVGRNMTVAACQGKCNEKADCTGIAVDTQSGECWRRKDIVLEKCDIAQYDTYVNEGNMTKYGDKLPEPEKTMPDEVSANDAAAKWTRKKALNCYVSHGATQIDDDSLGSMTVSACQVKCGERPDCTAIVVDTEDGECWRRKNVTLGNCSTEFGTQYDTYLKQAKSQPETYIF